MIAVCYRTNTYRGAFEASYKVPVIWRQNQNQTREEMRSLWFVWRLALDLFSCCYEFIVLKQIGGSCLSHTDNYQAIISCKATKFSTRHKISCIFKGTLSHLRQPIAILSQISTSYVSKTPLFENSSTYRFFQCFFPSGCPSKTLYATFLSPVHAICSVHLFLFDSVAWIIFGEYRS
jgi:hypothetical protein